MREPPFTDRPATGIEIESLVRRPVSQPTMSVLRSLRCRATSYSRIPGPLQDTAGARPSWRSGRPAFVPRRVRTLTSAD
jgi:hypothetical protein